MELKMDYFGESTATLPLEDFNLVMETENPANKIAFQWSIPNISKLPVSIRSSKFSLITGQLSEWDVTICRESRDTFQFSLSYHAQKTTDPIHVRSNSRFLTSRGSVLERCCQSTNVFYGGDQHPLITRVKILEPDELIFQCFMTVHGYGLVCSRNIYSKDYDQDIEELRNDYLNMMKSEEFADVKIKIEESYFSAHRCVLRYLAPKFFSYNQEWIEKQGVFSLMGVRSDVFEDVLHHIYCCEVNQMAMAQDFKEFYHMAVRFKLKSLLRASTMEIIYNLKTDNVRKFYQLAKDEDDEELVRYCEAFMEDNLCYLKSKDSTASYSKSDLWRANKSENGDLLSFKR